MNLLKEIKDAWGWTGVDPIEIVTENDFGNLILKDNEDQFWRMCPEDLYCEVVASSIDEYNELIQNKEFVDDWFMDSMVEEAKKSIGDLKPNCKYYMVIPGVLDGEYGGDNVKMASFVEIIKVSADVAKQIKDLPDGAEIKLKKIS
jgi:hypothetical protein